MEFAQMLEALNERIINEQLINATISQPRMRSNEVKRIKLKPVMVKELYHIQVEYQYERILKHDNILLADFPAKLATIFADFRQAQWRFAEESIHIQLSKKNKVLMVR